MNSPKVLSSPWQRAPSLMPSLLAVICISLLLFLLLLLSLSAMATGTQAARVPQAHGKMWYVSLQGADRNPCSSAKPCRTVQAALDKAGAGDIVKIARGTYTDTVGTVALITQSLTLQGGWDDSFTVHNPSSYPTELDAQRASPVVVLEGLPELPIITPTIEGFVLTGGNGTGVLGCAELSDPAPGGCGGGIYAANAIPQILNNTISDNIASVSGQGYGGGIYIQGITVGGLISGNTIVNNVAAISDAATVIGHGGGVNLSFASPLVRDNLIDGNRAAVGEGYGGGVRLRHSASTLYANVIRDNIASVATASTVVGHGGGIHVQQWEGVNGPTIVGNELRGNIASVGGQGTGGGIRLADVDVEITDNLIISNFASLDSTAFGNGGGLYAKLGTWLLYNNQVLSNVCTTDGPRGFGGGFQLEEGHAIVEGNLFAGNVARTSTQSRVAYGGGLNLLRCSGAVHGNVLRENIVSPMVTGNAGYGGGLSIRQNPANGAPVTVEGNLIFDNQSAELAGGVWLYGVAPVTLTNNFIAGNSAARNGGGICVIGSAEHPASAVLVHNTVAENSGNSGDEGIYVSGVASLSMINNIVVSHSTGICLDGSPPTVTAAASYTLFYHNTVADTSAMVASTNPISGQPAFVSSRGRDYHIGSDSAARDAGTRTWVCVDVDGDVRPIGKGVDIGADEFSPLKFYLPILLRSN